MKFDTYKIFFQFMPILKSSLCLDGNYFKMNKVFTNKENDEI